MGKWSPLVVSFLMNTAMYGWSHIIISELTMDKVREHDCKTFLQNIVDVN